MIKQEPIIYKTDMLTDKSYVPDGYVILGIVDDEIVIPF